MKNAWLLTAIAIGPLVLLSLVATGRKAIAWRFIAVELATAFSVAVLIVLSFAFDQPSSIDLALTLALLSMPGTLLLALFMERWL